MAQQAQQFAYALPILPITYFHPHLTQANVNDDTLWSMCTASIAAGQLFDPHAAEMADWAVQYMTMHQLRNPIVTGDIVRTAKARAHVLHEADAMGRFGAMNPQGQVLAQIQVLQHGLQDVKQTINNISAHESNARLRSDNHCLMRTQTP